MRANSIIGLSPHKINGFVQNKTSSLYAIKVAVGVNSYQLIVNKTQAGETQQK